MERSEQNYHKRMKILMEAKKIIVTKQYEIKNAKIEQKEQEKKMMKYVLQGVTGVW